jgi:trk system potassium uptake protein TrkA
MKIVICGAGLVGSAIASHLCEEQNDVTVIDASAENIQRITDQYDVHGVVGVASHPNRLAEAGVRDAELLIAVTESDEVNMVACQISHTIFNTPVKIARIRSTAYLDPAFASLTARKIYPSIISFRLRLKCRRRLATNFACQGHLMCKIFVTAK